MSELFGKSYTDIGDTSSDLLLKTNGKIKVLVGNKFIDLILDGKLSTRNSSTITNLKPIPVSDLIKMFKK